MFVNLLVVGKYIVVCKEYIFLLDLIIFMFSIHLPALSPLFYIYIYMVALHPHCDMGESLHLLPSEQAVMKEYYVSSI